MAKALLEANGFTNVLNGENATRINQALLRACREQRHRGYSEAGGGTKTK